MYTGDIDTQGLTNATQTLLDILKLADFWGMEDLNLATQEALVPHIDHNTYFDISPHAREFKAEHLLASCEEFESKNSDILIQLADSREENS